MYDYVYHMYYLQTISQTVRLDPDRVNGITVDVTANCPSGYEMHIYLYIVFTLDQSLQQRFLARDDLFKLMPSFIILANWNGFIFITYLMSECVVLFVALFLWQKYIRRTLLIFYCIYYRIVKKFGSKKAWQIAASFFTNIHDEAYDHTILQNICVS